MQFLSLTILLVLVIVCNIGPRFSLLPMSTSFIIHILVSQYKGNIFLYLFIIDLIISFSLANSVCVSDITQLQNSCIIRCVLFCVYYTDMMGFARLLLHHLPEIQTKSQQKTVTSTYPNVEQPDTHPNLSTL